MSCYKSKLQLITSNPIKEALKCSIRNLGQLPVNDPMNRDQNHMDDINELIQIGANQAMHYIDNIDDFLPERNRNLSGCSNAIYNIIRLINDDTRSLNLKEYNGILDKCFQIIKYLPGLNDDFRRQKERELDLIHENRSDQEEQVVPQQISTMFFNTSNDSL